MIQQACKKKKKKSKENKRERDVQQRQLTCVHNRPWQSSQGKREAPNSLDFVLSTLLTLIKELSFLRRFKECNLVGGRAVIPERTCACAEGAHYQKTPCALQTIFLVEQATDFNPFKVPVCGVPRPLSSRRYPALSLLRILYSFAYWDFFEL